MSLSVRCIISGLWKNDFRYHDNPEGRHRQVHQRVLIPMPVMIGSQRRPAGRRGRCKLFLHSQKRGHVSGHVGSGFIQEYPDRLCPGCTVHAGEKELLVVSGKHEKPAFFIGGIRPARCPRRLGPVDAVRAVVRGGIIGGDKCIFAKLKPLQLAKGVLRHVPHCTIRAIDHAVARGRNKPAVAVSRQETNIGVTFRPGLAVVAIQTGMVVHRQKPPVPAGHGVELRAHVELRLIVAIAAEQDGVNANRHPFPVVINNVGQGVVILVMHGGPGSDRPCFCKWPRFHTRR